MTEAPQTFSFYGQDVRVAIIDGEAWFVAKDVCEAIGIYSYPEILKCMGEDEKRLGMFPDTDNNRFSHLSFINENAVFKLMFKCASREAEAFAKWINHEVIPVLRGECWTTYRVQSEQSRSLLEKISMLHHLARNGYSLLYLPGNLSLNTATNLLQNYGFFSKD